MYAKIKSIYQHFGTIKFEVVSVLVDRNRSMQSNLSTSSLNSSNFSKIKDYCIIKDNKIRSLWIWIERSFNDDLESLRCAQVYGKGINQTKKETKMTHLRSASRETFRILRFDSVNIRWHLNYYTKYFTFYSRMPTLSPSFRALDYCPT